MLRHKSLFFNFLFVFTSAHTNGTGVTSSALRPSFGIVGLNQLIWYCRQSQHGWLHQLHNAYIPSLFLETEPSGSCKSPPGTSCAENELGGGSFISGMAFPLSSYTSFDFNFLFTMLGDSRTAEEGTSARLFAANAAFGLYRRMLLALSEGALVCRVEEGAFVGRSFDTLGESSNLWLG